MGTTKLTRKEILAEDPVRNSIVGLVELFRSRKKIIASGAAGLILIAVGLYFGLRYLEQRSDQVQLELGRAIDSYHAQIDPEASDDPYGKGATPLFRTETDKYQAAVKAFSSIVAKYGSSKQGVVARYYLGLSQLKAGNQKEALQSLESVRDNTRDRTVGNLARKVIALHYLDKGNYKGAQEILEGMIKDPQCKLPKEDLRVDLSRAYMAGGKRDQAMNVLREGQEQAGSSLLHPMLVEETKKLEAISGIHLENPKPAPAQP